MTEGILVTIRGNLNPRVRANVSLTLETSISEVRTVAIVRHFNHRGSVWILNYFLNLKGVMIHIELMRRFVMVNNRF